jgi:hypothetical protein
VSVCYEPGSEDWIPGRGDYGTEYSFDLVDLVERMNCSAGCVFAISANSGGLGPGGTCSILNQVGLGENVPIPELDPRPSGPFCRKQRVPAEQALAGQGDLFTITTAGQPVAKPRRMPGAASAGRSSAECENCGRPIGCMLDSLRLDGDHQWRHDDNDRRECAPVPDRHRDLERGERAEARPEPPDPDER